MRSHLITISSKEKKLPPLINDGRIDLFRQENSQTNQRRQEKPISADDKLCKECGKTFQSWKALFGHMKCHSVIGSVEEDSWNSSSNHHHKPIIITDSNMSSDNEATLLSRKKRSGRTKRYTNSSSLSVANLSPLEQKEQEEVALSLILMSMDCVSSVVESHSTSSESSEVKRTKSSSSADRHCLKFKKLDTEFRAKRKRLKSSESEVNSPKTLIKRRGSVNPFGSDHRKKKKKCIDSNNSEVNECKFSCIICKKGFPSYQALGGHRASHKKFKGCCAPTSENGPQTDDLAADFQEKVDAGVECKKSREHECPICFRVFPSGQALGGHKRSHLMGDQAKNTDPSVSNQRRIPEIRGFPDLNLPAPVEEDCNEFKPWWIGTSHKSHHEPLLGLLSS